MIFSQNSTFGDGDDVVRAYDNSAAQKVALGDNFQPISARYLRYDVTAVGAAAANTGVSEFIFYQVPEPSTSALVALGMAGLVRRQGS